PVLGDVLTMFESPATRTSRARILPSRWRWFASKAERTHHPGRRIAHPGKAARHDSRDGDGAEEGCEEPWTLGAEPSRGTRPRGDTPAEEGLPRSHGGAPLHQSAGDAGGHHPFG